MNTHTPAVTTKPGPASQPWLGVGGLLLALLPALCAAQLSPDSKREIDSLLRAVGASGCEFVRGSTAYPAAMAQQHLQKKYDYLAERQQLNSAEQFIVKAATRSSMTGEAYAIRCTGAAPQASDEWLRARLKIVQQTSAAPR